MRKYLLLLVAALFLSKCFAQPYILKKIAPGHYMGTVHNNDGVNRLDTLTVELKKHNRCVFRGDYFESHWHMTGVWKMKNDTLILVNDYPAEKPIPVKVLPHRQVGNPYLPDIIDKKGKLINDFWIDGAIDSTNEPIMYTIQDTAARIRIVSGFGHSASSWFRPPKDGGYQIMVALDISLKNYNEWFRAVYFLVRKDSIEWVKTD
ncbi:hypothetical protein [Taibaiella soli]|uniref:Uncharacterized protein n=1 Tax=Taibaiella soli TaxID=1649169 RepID=A0A2W2A7M5_9BACT|nr:hypothetical protein [Taibaiella soli]PZF71251.1 hypothetical protein DN068_18305 [Taibaiella soli]